MTNTQRKSGPIVQSFEETAVATHMFKAAMCYLGEPIVDALPTPENPGPPFFCTVALPAGVGHTNSHYHPGYSFLIFPTGGYGLGEKFFPAGTVMITDPRAATGECYPAPEGSTEFAFYESQWGGTPFFLNTDDPRGTKMLGELGAFGTQFAQQTPPGPVPGASETVLDRSKHAIKRARFTAYTAQLGPKNFTAVPTANDPRPYVTLVEFEPDAIIPEHCHDGLVGMTVVDGTIEVCGEPRSNDVLLKFPPYTPLSVKVGKQPARAIFYFESGKAAIPIFEDDSVAGVSDVQAMFGKA
jgi:quercetin dioxygenase-like cupin family protein